MTVLRTLSLACILATVSVAAQARTRHVESIPAFDRHTGSTEIGSRMFIRDAGQRRVKTAGIKQIRKRHERERRTRERSDAPSRHYAARTRVSGEAQILPHPPGCPARAFCGCGASIEVFGKSVRELWLARNWYRFPRTSPAPGMVAVRRHHVFVIREVRAPGLVLAYDANSGGRKTRIHLRRLAGYTVVNPRGSRYASAGD